MRKSIAALALAALSLPALAATPATPPIDRTILHAQVILDHLGFSPGVIDGKRGQSLRHQRPKMR